MKAKHAEPKQLELFTNEPLNQNQLVNLKPRDKAIPATKDTESSSSIFGWRFQITAGIILSIKNISELKSVEVEGPTEDIELYFKKKDPEYVQVKAIQKNYLDVKDTKKVTLAMNTLINTSNITHGKYSKLVYVANFRNPLHLNKALLEASWKPSMDSMFYRKYNNLPSDAKKFICSRITLAQKQLKAGKYQSTIKNFNLNRLYIATILFSPDEDSNSVSVLKGLLGTLFQTSKVHIRDWKLNEVKARLMDYYLANAGSSSTSERHLTITKEKLIWRIIFELINDIDDDFEKEIPMYIIEDVEEYVNSFIEDQVHNIDVINKVYAAIANYYPNAYHGTTKEINEFIKNKWEIFKADFPLDENPEVQEYGIKMLIKKMISEQKTVRKIKRAVNIK